MWAVPEETAEEGGDQGELGDEGDGISPDAKGQGVTRPPDLQEATAVQKLLGRGCSLREDPENSRKETAHRKQSAEATAQGRQVGMNLPVTLGREPKHSRGLQPGHPQTLWTDV